VLKGSIEVFARKVERDIGMRRYPFRSGCARATLRLVHRVEHEVDVANAQPTPVAVLSWRRGVHDLEAENPPIEGEGPGHVEHLEQSALALDG